MMGFGSGLGTRSVPTRRLWAAVLLGYLALGATMQLLPSWVTEVLGQSSFAAGAAVAVAFLATAAVRPIAGDGADRGKARQFVILGGILIAAGSLVSMAATDLVVLFAGRLTMGAGEALLFGAAISWVLAACPPQRRGAVSGLFGLSMWAGLALGPVAASVVEEGFGLVGVWCLVVALSACSLLMAASSLLAAAPRRENPARSSLRSLLPRSALLPGLVFGLAGFGYGAVSAGLVLFMVHQHMASAAGLPAFAAAFLCVRALGSGTVDRHGGPRVAMASLLVAACGATLLTVSSTTAVAIGGAALLGAGTSLMFPATVTWSLSRRTVDHLAGPGASIGVSTSFWDLGLASGGLVTGALIEISGYTAAWAVTAAVLASAALITLAVVRRS